MRMPGLSLLRLSLPRFSLPRRPVPHPAALPAVGLACAVAIAGCTSGGSAGPSGSPAGSRTSAPAQVSALHWHNCSAQDTALRCASLPVPLDYSHPAGRKIVLALSEVPATAPPARQQGALLVNPGGPGGSGLGLASFVAQGLDPSVASEYNIIGFDTRGVGSSVPALHCDPSFFTGVRPDYIPANQRDEQVLISRAKTYAADCQHRFGWLLPFMTTENIARDMDAIRAAMGQQQISYFAYSYGTYIGQVYATLFPHRVRRMVLDSTVDPRGVWYADNIGQDYAFEGRMEAFFSWVASHPTVYGLGSTRAQVEQAWYRARAKLAAHPIAGPAGPLMGPDEFDDTFLQGGYTSALWPGLATALSAYLRTGATSRWSASTRRSARRTRTSSPSTTRWSAADVSWPRSWAKWNADTRRVYRTAPFQAWDNAWFNAACAFWPFRGPGQPATDRERGAARNPYDPGHPGCGDPVRGRAGRAQAAAHAPGWWSWSAAATTASRWPSHPTLASTAT